LRGARGRVQPRGRRLLCRARSADQVRLMATARLRTTVPAYPAVARPPRSLWADAWRQFRRHRLAMAGFATLSFLILATLVGPLIYTEPTNGIDFKQALRGPSFAHPFGTDNLGRDLLARCLYGGNISMAVGIMAVTVAITVGTLVGAISGFFGK